MDNPDDQSTPAAAWFEIFCSGLEPLVTGRLDAANKTADAVVDSLHAGAAAVTSTKDRLRSAPLPAVEDADAFVAEVTQGLEELTKEMALTADRIAAGDSEALNSFDASVFKVRPLGNLSRLSAADAHFSEAPSCDELGLTARYSWNEVVLDPEVSYSLDEDGMPILPDE